MTGTYLTYRSLVRGIFRDRSLDERRVESALFHLVRRMPLSNDDNFKDMVEAIYSTTTDSEIHRLRCDSAIIYNLGDRWSISEFIQNARAKWTCPEGDFNDEIFTSRDGNIHFEPENHKYTVFGEEYISATTFISSFFPPFEKEKIAAQLSRKTGKPAASYIREWEKAAEDGTLLHERIDALLHGRSVEAETEDFKLFQQFIENNYINPARTEWTIYDEDSRIAGTVDLLNQDSCCGLTLIDWKRSKNLVDGNGNAITSSRFASNAYAPISHLCDVSFWHYALQQNLYRYILKKNYKIFVWEMKLVVLHPSLESYKILEVPVMEKEIEALIKYRKAEIYSR